MGYEFELSEGYAVASYHPRAFYIKLNIHTESPDLDSLLMAPQAVPTLLHEVGHLVQDRCTLFGVHDFLLFYKGMSSFQRYIDHTPRADPIPIPAREHPVGNRIPGESTEMWMAQAEALRNTSYPRHAWPAEEAHWEYLEHSRKRTELPLGDEVRHPWEIMIRLVDNVSSRELSHPFGAWEIKEAYSVAISLIHGDKDPDPREGYEYLVVDRILHKLFGVVDPRQVIALCHWSLQSREPGHHFFEIVEAYTEQYGTALLPADQLYDFCRQFTISGSYESDARGLLDVLSARAKQHAGANPNGNFAALLSWYDRSARQFLGVNQAATRRFPLDTFLATSSRKMSDGEVREGMRRLFSEVPVPMLETADGATFAIGGNHLDDASVFFIRSLSHLTRLIWAGRDEAAECPVYNACQLAIKGDACLHRPWDKALLQVTCSMGAAAKYLAVGGRSFLPSVPPQHFTVSAAG